MQGLAIATFPVAPTAISGESLPFRTVLENRGATPIQVPSPDSPSQFTYELRSQREGGRTYAVSAAGRNRRRAVHVPAPVPVRYETLDPGQRLEWTEDIADFLNEGIEPGKYSVTAAYADGNVISPKTQVTVLPDNVESLSSTPSGSSLASVQAHRRADGAVNILQRESLKDPRETVFYPLQSLPAGIPVSVATTTDVVPAGSGRWFAWLRGRTLAASVGWGDRTIITPDPVNLDVTQPELLSPGYQVAVGTALFGIIDRRGNTVHLLAYRADESGLRRHWTAALTSGGAAKVEWNCQSDGSVTVVWEEPATGRLLSQEFRADGHPLEAAARVRSSSRPAAWSVAPSGPLAISVLREVEGSYRYARLGAAPMADPHPIAHLGGVVAWGFNPTAESVAIVAATASGISQTHPGGAWETLVETANPRMMHVFTIEGGASWVEWVQQGYGIRRAKLR